MVSFASEKNTYSVNILFKSSRTIKKLNKSGIVSLWAVGEVIFL